MKDKHGDRWNLWTACILINIVSLQPLSNMDTNHPCENYRTKPISFAMIYGWKFILLCLWLPLEIIRPLPFDDGIFCTQHQPTSTCIRIICFRNFQKHLFIIIMARGGKWEWKFIFLHSNGRFCFKSKVRVFMWNYRYFWQQIDFFLVHLSIIYVKSISQTQKTAPASK